MILTKRLKIAILASAVAVLGFGAAPAMAADTSFGSCIGVGPTPGPAVDCTAATGHASVSVTGTLSVNEMRGMSFGNIAATHPLNTATIVLNLDGSRTITGFTGLHGLNANDGGSPGSSPANANSGGQSPGHYTITGEEAGPTQVYISFANAGGQPIDMCSGPETTCDNYYSGNKVTFTGGELTLDHFFINESGSDVYGHYVLNAGQAPGTSTPWNPGTAAGSGHDGTPPSGGGIDIVVGGTLHSDGSALTVGKHIGTFDIIASY